MTGRHFGMDWLRIGAFGLLIFYHIGMYFVPWDWHVKIEHPIEWPEVPMLASNAWRLALLFAVSGYATRRLAERSGNPMRLLGSRTSRLLVPLLFGMAVIVPVQSWIQLRTQHGYAPGFWHFWSSDYFRFGELDGIVLPTWNHLWFVAYLWTYSLILCLALWVPERARRQVARTFEALLSGPLVLIVPMAALAFQEFVLLPDAEETFMLFNDWAQHIVFFPIFMFGFLLGSSGRLWDAIRRYWKIAAVVALLGYSGVVAIFEGWLDGFLPHSATMVVWELARIAQGWGAIVALIGIADRFLNRDLPGRKTLTEAVFPFYIIHQTIIVFVGWLLLSTGVGPAQRFAVLFAATVTGCWGFYRLGREISWLRPIIGLKAAATGRDTLARLTKTASAGGLVHEAGRE